MNLQEQLNKIRQLSGLKTKAKITNQSKHTYLGEEISTVKWLLLTEEEKVRNLNFNKKDQVINNLVTKIGASKEMAEWAYSKSEKYCIWLLNSIKSQYGIDNINGESTMYFNGIKTNVDLIITKVFNIKNKPITEIKNLSFYNAIKYVDNIGYINDWADNPDVETPDLTRMTWDEAMTAATEWHESLKSKGGSIQNEQGTVIHKFADGCYWINTHKHQDTDEGKAAGHCGTASRSDMVLVSLRNNKKEVLVTFDYDEKTKEIIQFKGKNNTKPVSKYHPYIIWLLSKKDIVHELNTNQGYQPESNFQLSDLTEDERNKVFKSNPVMIPNSMITAEFLDEISEEDKLNLLKVKIKGVVSKTLFMILPDELKTEYTVNSVNKKNILLDYEFAWAPDDIKLADCNKTIKERGYLFDYQFLFVSDEMKMEDCKNWLEYHNYLEPHQFAWVPDEYKLVDCINTMNSDYGYIEDFQKEWYIQYKSEHPELNLQNL